MLRSLSVVRVAQFQSFVLLSSLLAATLVFAAGERGHSPRGAEVASRVEWFKSQHVSKLLRRHMDPIVVQRVLAKLGACRRRVAARRLALCVAGVPYVLPNELYARVPAVRALAHVGFVFIGVERLLSLLSRVLGYKQ